MCIVEVFMFVNCRSGRKVAVRLQFELRCQAVWRENRRARVVRCLPHAQRGADSSRLISAAVTDRKL